MTSAIGPTGNRSLWRSLQEDHDHIWDLINLLTGGSGEPEGPERERRKTALRLVAVESAHEAAEAMVVWPAVRLFVPDGAKMATDALAQEGQARRAISVFRRIKPGTVEFDRCLNAISGLARAHMTYEQNQVWPALESAVSPEQACQLARLWRHERKRASTRPHPHAPPVSGVLAGVGRMAAMMDRARDFVVLRDRV